MTIPASIRFARPNNFYRVDYLVSHFHSPTLKRSLNTSPRLENQILNAAHAIGSNSQEI